MDNECNMHISILLLFIPFIDCTRMVFHTSPEMLNMEMTKDVIGTYINTDGGYQSCAQLCMMKVKCRSFTFFETSGDCQVSNSCPVIFMSLFFYCTWAEDSSELLWSCVVRYPSSSVRRPSLTYHIFSFSSETAELNSTQLYRNLDLNGLYHVLFGPIVILRWSPQALRYFRLLLWNLQMRQSVFTLSRIQYFSCKKWMPFYCLINIYCSNSKMKRILHVHVYN